MSVRSRRAYIPAGRGTKRFSCEIVYGERGLLRLERLPLTAPLCACGEASRRPGCGSAARPVVCPAKAGMFSRRQTCRGRSQSPVVWIAEVMETETLKPIDEVSPGEATRHRDVTKVNALWPRK